MIHLSNQDQTKSPRISAISLVIIGILIAPLALCCVSSAVGAQGSQEELKRSAQGPAQPKTTPSPAPQPASPESRTGALQPTDASLPRGALASALATCDSGSESSEPLALPGARGEVKLG